MKGFINFWKFVLLFFLVSVIYSFFFGDWLGFSFNDFLPFLTISLGIVVFGLLDSIQKIDSTLHEKNQSQPTSKMGFDGIEIGEKDGLHKKYYPNGVLKCEGEYFLNFRFGDWKEFSEDGDLRETSHYLIGGIKWGESKRYSNKGELVEVLSFSDGRINKRTFILNGEKRIQEYFKNGELKINIVDKVNLDTNSYGNFVQNHINGELHLLNIQDSWEYYDLKGQTYKKFEWKDGELNGFYEEYHENGVISTRCNFIKNKREGLSETYFDNGNISSRCHCIENQIDGLYESFYENGNKDSIMNYKKGVLNGVTEYYFENGELMVKCNYSINKKEGIEERFNEKGKIVSITTFKNGVEVSKKNQVSIWILNRIKF
jgi:antitoxin component YwqK of YwqJK toxin-antitoxin module